MAPVSRMETSIWFLALHRPCQSFVADFLVYFQGQDAVTQ